MSNPTLGPYSSEVKQFCSKRPLGTNAIFNFNSEENKMQLNSKEYDKFWAGPQWTRPCCQNGSYDNTNDCSSKSSVSGDFDNDQIADHIFLYQNKLVFFFSSDRPRGEMIDNAKFIGLEIDLPGYCEGGTSVQLVDLDNDGKEEIFVSCENASVFLIYTKGATKTQWFLQNRCNGNGALGALSDRLLALPTHSELKDFCDTFTKIGWKFALKRCNQYYSSKQRRKFTMSDALTFVDFNNDGFPDIVYTADFGHLRFFENRPVQSASANKFIRFILLGRKQNELIPNIYHSIGATVILFCRRKDGTPDGTIVKQFREISSIQHHTDKFGSKDERLIFGLGKDMVPKKIRIRWANGNEQSIGLQNWKFQGDSESPIEIVDTTSKFCRCVVSLLFHQFKLFYQT